MDKEKEAENEELTNQALAALAALGYHVSAADLGKLNPPDVFESELELMAEVRAYFQIAYKVRCAMFAFFARLISYSLTVLLNSELSTTSP